MAMGDANTHIEMLGVWAGDRYGNASDQAVKFGDANKTSNEEEEAARAIENIFWTQQPAEHSASCFLIFRIKLSKLW